MKSLASLYKEHAGKVSDKWSLYIDAYEDIFAPYRSQPVSLLEIGIQNGGSLEVWEKYFPNFQNIIGCDVDPKCEMLSYANKNIHVIVGDANSEESKNSIFNISPNFEIIIDDGSHLSSDIVKSFLLYFPLIKEGGIFVAEDLHCSYWMQYEGGIYHPYSSVAFFKKLADIVNYEHWGNEKSRSDLLKGFFTRYSCSLDEDTLSQIYSIQFINSICVIKKAGCKKNLLGTRIVSGIEVVVSSDPLSQKDKKYKIHPSLLQFSNGYSMREFGPDEVIDVVERLLSEANIRIENLDQDLVIRDSAIETLNQELAQKVSAIETLNQELAQRDAVISHILQSNSWKITAPLRKVGVTIRRAIFFVRSAIRGFKGLSAKVPLLYQIYKREGAIGVYIKIRGYLLQKKFLLLGSGLDLSQLQIRSTDYLRWFGLYAAITPQRRASIKAKIVKLEKKPLVSVVMPTYNANHEWLVQAIDSVRKQLYENWELCIADDASTDDEVHLIMQKYANLDSRIKLQFREKNGHISAATNTAISASSGEWIAFLDHDDLITEDALFWIVKGINDNPHAQILYSDEDKIDSGHISSPYFKCEFNRDLLYSQNYICHLSAFERNLINEVGQLREGYEGAQDYDLVLRCIEKLDSVQIVHIPRILYHWRMHHLSTALSVDNKDYAVDAGIRALRDHLKRMSINASVVGDGRGMYKVEYLLPKIEPIVTIIIPTKNKKLLLEKCINSIINRTAYKNYEIIIVDNNSSEKDATDYINLLGLKKNIKIIHDSGDFNYSALNNKAVNIAEGEYLCLLNNDIEVITPNWLGELVGIASQNGVGAVGARLWYPNNTLQHGGVITGLGGIAGHSHKYLPMGVPGYFRRAEVIQQLSAVTGACLVVRKTKYLEVGGLNEQDLSVAFNDVDFCLNLDKLGYRNIWTPYAELYHHESLSRGADDSKEKQIRFQGEVEFMSSKWEGRLVRDPYYSPNLTICHEDFSYAWPPRVEII